MRQLGARVAGVALVASAASTTAVAGLAATPARAQILPPILGGSTTAPTSPPTTRPRTPPSTSATTQPPSPATTSPPATAPKPKGARPNVPTAGPPTVPAAPTTKAPAINAGPLLKGVQSDLDQLQALTNVGFAREEVAAATQAQRQAAAQSAAAARAVTAAEEAHSRAKLWSDTSNQRLAALAVAAYTGEENVAPVPDPASSPLPGLIGGDPPAAAQVLDPAVETADARVLLNTVVGQAKAGVARGRRQVSVTAKAVGAAQAKAKRAAAVAARANAAADGAQHILAATLHAAVTPGVAPPPLTPSAAAPPSPPTTATQPAAGPPPSPASEGPPVLGPPTLDAVELAGWFASTGRRANTTVPISQLASYYIAASGQTGVRGDIAFAQSVVETGFFSFPSYGQVAKTDNNFAGIGACDTCAHGWRFPNAQVGVSAQLQLLDAYASTTQVPTPLVGPVGVGGCCPTWMSLAGTWATNPNYGVEILTVYKQMLDWTIPRRLAAAHLGPPVPGIALADPTVVGPAIPAAVPAPAAPAAPVAPKLAPTPSP